MADKIVGEYDVRVDKALKDLDKLSKRVDKIDKDGQKSAKNVEQSYSKMASSLSADFKKLGQVIGVTFAIDQVRRFAAESIRVAANLEGVERAFRRIGSPQILEGLRKATRGTVSDLELMKNAVRASNFKIPLENLASLFKFAQARARETGESVDYLVDSIILGIGRKSPLILDNLGISAVELRKRLRGVGVEAADVGDIAQIIGDIATEELEKMGEQADTTADKIAQINVVLENTKAIIGKALIVEISNLTDDFSGLTEQVDKLLKTGEDVSGWEKALSFGLRSLTTGFRVVGSVAERTLLIVNGVKDGVGELAENVKIETYRLSLSGDELERFNELSRLQQLILIRGSEATEDYADFTEDAERATRLFNKAVADGGGEGGEVSQYVRSINQLNEELKTLKEQFNQAEIGGTDFYRLADEIEAKIKEINLALRLLAERKFATQPDQEIDTIGADLLQTQQLETDEIIDDYERRNKEIEKLIEERNKLEKEKAEERAENERQTALAITEQTLTTISQLTATISQIQQNAFRREREELQKQLEEGLITREEFEKKELDIRRKSAQAAKDAALFQAVINTAQAVMQALANTPPPASYALAAVAGALGAVQIAAIASEPLPTFAEGGMVAEHGMLKGKSHRQGGILIEAEGEEYFMPKDKTRKHYGLLEAIRQGAEEQYILKNYVPKMIDESMFSGFADMGKSAELNGITANLKDHNLIAAIDRDRQSTSYGLNMVARKLDKLTNVNTRKGW